jgi:hypothetical protein
MNSRAGANSNHIIHEVEELDAPPSLFGAAMTLPVATSANRFEVPLRL